MSKLATALIAAFFSVSLAHAADQTTTEKKKSDKPDSARAIMLKERTPEQKKLADCSLKASSDELQGKERTRFIDKCMGK